MNIGVVGLSYKTAKYEIRENAFFTARRKRDMANSLMELGAKGVVILSTCNRSEIYFSFDENITRIDDVVSLYCKKLDIQDEKYVYSRSSKDAARHLFMVASGLDSLVIGEDQILCQVREALDFSLEAGYGEKAMNRLFMEAIACARHVKRELKISEHPISTAYVGVKFIKNETGGINGKNAMVIGLGNIGKLCIDYLVEEGAKEVFAVGRRGKDYAVGRYGNVHMTDYEHRYERLKDCEVLICATSAPHAIITKEAVLKTEKELFILDMAVPRDVEAQVGEIENVRLRLIDDIEKILEHNEQRRERLSIRAFEIVNERLSEFTRWLELSKFDPIISALNQKCEEVKNEALSSIRSKMDLSPKQYEMLERTVKSSLKKILKEPISNLKSKEEGFDAKGYALVLEDIFLKRAAD
ncbi:glutamyl-tRNA reductase [Peptoclostridium litorale]|nr:glutamyl-tRNA reductase [Peptoclostridium litorale]